MSSTSTIPHRRMPDCRPPSTTGPTAAPSNGGNLIIRRGGVVPLVTPPSPGSGSSNSGASSSAFRLIDHLQYFRHRQQRHYVRNVPLGAEQSTTPTVLTSASALLDNDMIQHPPVQSQFRVFGAADGGVSRRHQPLGSSMGGSSSNSNNSKIRRALFGPVDHEENVRFVRRELANGRREASERWNFDFENDCPINEKEGRYVWQPLQSACHGVYNEKEMRVPPIMQHTHLITPPGGSTDPAGPNLHGPPFRPLVFQPNGHTSSSSVRHGRGVHQPSASRYADERSVKMDYWPPSSNSAIGGVKCCDPATATGGPDGHNLFSDGEECCNDTASNIGVDSNVAIPDMNSSRQSCSCSCNTDTTATTDDECGECGICSSSTYVADHPKCADEVLDSTRTESSGVRFVEPPPPVMKRSPSHDAAAPTSNACDDETEDCNEKDGEAAERRRKSRVVTRSLSCHMVVRQNDDNDSVCDSTEFCATKDDQDVPEKGNNDSSPCRVNDKTSPMCNRLRSSSRRGISTNGSRSRQRAKSVANLRPTGSSRVANRRPVASHSTRKVVEFSIDSPEEGLKQTTMTDHFRCERKSSSYDLRSLTLSKSASTKNVNSKQASTTTTVRKTLVRRKQIGTTCLLQQQKSSSLDGEQGVKEDAVVSGLCTTMATNKRRTLRRSARTTSHI